MKCKNSNMAIEDPIVATGEQPLISENSLDLESTISVRMTRLLWRIYNYGDRGDLGSEKMSLREWRVLSQLGKRGRMSVSEISISSGVGHTVISRALRSLQKKNFVETRKSSKDKRQTLSQMTPEGLRIHDIIAPRRKMFLQEVQMGLSAAEHETLFSLIDKLEHHLDVLTANDGDGWDQD